MPSAPFTPPPLDSVERFRPPPLDSAEAFVPPPLDSEEVDRVQRGSALRAEQVALREPEPAGFYRDMALPRAVVPVEAKPAREPAGIYRDMAQGYRPDMARGFQEAAFTPIATLVNAPTMARGLDMLAMGAEFAEGAATGRPPSREEMEERLARDVTPGVASRALAGVQQTAAGLTSPAAVAMLGAGPVVGALPALAQRGVAAGFAGLMTAGAAQNAAEAIEAFRQDDVEGFARAASGFGLDATLALAGTYGAGRGLAAGSPRISRWLTTEAQRSIPPEQIRGALARVDAGGGSPAEIELARLLRGSGVEGLAESGGLTVRAQVPRVGPGMAEWLGVPRGRVTEMELRGQPAEAGTPPLLAEAPATGGALVRSPMVGAVDPRLTPPMPKAEATRIPRMGTDLTEAGLGEGVETLPPGEWDVVGMGKRRRVNPEVPGVPEALEGQPYERTVESPELRVERAEPETSNVQQPTAKDETGKLPDFAQRAGVKSWKQADKLGLRAVIEEAPELSRKVVSAAANWIYGSVESAATHIAAEIVARTKVLGGREAAFRSLANDYWRKAQGATEPGQAQRFKATAQALEALSVKPSPPPAAPVDLGADLAELRSQRDKLEAHRKAEDAKPRRRGLRSAKALALEKQVLDLDARIIQTLSARTAAAPPVDVGEQEVAREVERVASITGPLSTSERINLNELRLASQSKRLSVLSQAYLANLEERYAAHSPPAGPETSAPAVESSYPEPLEGQPYEVEMDPEAVKRASDLVATKKWLAREVKLPEPVKQKTAPARLALAAQKKFLLSEVDALIAEAPEGEMFGEGTTTHDRPEVVDAKLFDVLQRNVERNGIVHIEIPGDGTFDIVNTKAALREFKARAKKFPVKSATMPDPRGARTEATNPTPIPAKPTQEALLKALEPFVSTDPNRVVLHNVWSDGRQTVATNGRMMLVVNRGIGAVNKDGRTYTLAGKPVSEGDAQFPNWRQVVPPEDVVVPVFSGLDTARLFNLGQQAAGVLDERHEAVKLWLNPDRSLGLEAEGDAGSYAHNMQPGAVPIVALNGEYFLDVVNAARRLGAEKLDFAVSAEPGEAAGQSEVLFTGKDFKAVVMPMRLGGEFDKRGTTARSVIERMLGREPTPNGDSWSERFSVVRTARVEGRGKQKRPATGYDVIKAGTDEVVKQGFATELDAMMWARRAAVTAETREGKSVKAGGTPAPLGGGSSHASVGDFRAPVPARPAQAPAAPAGAGFADSGLFVDGVEVRLGGAGAVNPVLLPEIYRLFSELTGGDSPFLRRYRRANGMFYPEGAGRIGLHPDLFKFPAQLAYTMAHEFGHLLDYLPDRALDRGNIFGRIGTLRQWLTTTFPLSPRTSLDEVLKPKDRAKLRRQAENEIRRELGPRPSKEDSEADWSTWGNEVTKRYQELVQEEIDTRGLVSLAQVRDELLALTQWWRPYDPETVPESYRKYRESSVELYADALSVLFNSPGHLEKMAPTFYRMFWSWLETKPEVKAALAEIQALIARGDPEVLRARLAEDVKDFAQGRDAFEAAHAEQERAFWDVKAIAGKLMRQLGDRGAALAKAVRGERGGGLLPKGDDMRELWEQSLMHDNVGFQLMQAVAERVIQPLHAAGLDPAVDLGIYLKHTRIQGNKSAREELDLIKDRLGRATYLLAEKFADLMEELTRKGLAETQMIDKVILPAEAAGIEFDDLTEINRLKLEQGTRVDIANPRLVQARESERTLNQHLADLGPAKADVLRQAAAAFREIVFGVVEQMHAAELITDRQFQTAQANRHTYAAFRPLDHVETWVSWAFRRAKGSAKPIENPFVTTLLKMQSAIHATLENRAKLKTRDGITAVDPASFVKAETYWNGRGQQAKPVAKGMERLVVREHGRPVAYDVDPAIAEAFTRLTPFEQDTAAAWVNWFFHQTLYKGYVSWSLPFNFWRNPIRDVGATHLALRGQFGGRAPDAADLARAYKDAWADAKKYVNGELTPLAQEALEFFAIYAPTDAFYAQFPQDDPSHALFAKLGLVPEPVNRARQFGNKLPGIKQALLLGDWIQHQGQMREAVGKLGPWLALKRAGITPEEAAPFVRNYTGTPNLKVSGSASAWPQALLPFYRIYTQALLRWLRLTTNPTTRGGYWFRWATTRGVLRVMLTLAGMGWLGKELKDWMAGVPEYERTRGIPVPLPPLALPGGDYGKKSVFLRLPDDEFSAFAGYSLDNALRVAAGQKDAGTAAGQSARAWLDAIPGMNPFLNVGAQWVEYGTGGVPEDTFRHRPVLTEAERKAGGAAALGKMVMFSLDKAGVPFLRVPTSESTSQPESVLRFTPLLKDMVKITDGGYREQDREQRDAVERVKYAIRMGYGVQTKVLLHHQAQLERAGATRTLPQEADWRYLQQWNTNYNALDQAIVTAAQAGDRARAKELTGRLETLSERFKTGMEAWHVERDAGRVDGARLEPWNQERFTNAVPRATPRR